MLINGVLRFAIVLILGSDISIFEFYYSSIYHRYIGHVLHFLAVNAPYSVLMGDLLNADFQFLSLARVGTLPP